MGGPVKPLKVGMSVSWKMRRCEDAGENALNKTECPQPMESVDIDMERIDSIIDVKELMQMQVQTSDVRSIKELQRIYVDPPVSPERDRCHN